MECSLVGRRGRINLQCLHDEMEREKAAHDPSFGKFVFRAWQSAPRPEWHGKNCTILAKNGGVVSIDGIDSKYELLPLRFVELEEVSDGV